MFCPPKLLESAEQPMAGPSSFGGQNIEGDNFQNYGGKDQCIYLSRVSSKYPAIAARSYGPLTSNMKRTWYKDQVRRIFTYTYLHFFQQTLVVY